MLVGPLKGGRSGLMYASNMRDSGVEVLFGLHVKDSKEMQEKEQMQEENENKLDKISKASRIVENGGREAFRCKQIGLTLSL